MNNTVYHLLTESSYFSDIHGGGGQRWVANMMMQDPDSKVICKIADRSWGFPEDRVFQLPILEYYDRIKPLHRHYPFFIRRWPLRKVISTALTRLRENDVLWVHNQPDFAEAVAPFVKERGAKLVLHLHNSYLTAIPGKRIPIIPLDKLVFVSHFLEDEGKRCFPHLKNTIVIHNGADEHCYYPSTTPRSDADVPIVIFAGRLVEDKGPHVLVEALRLLEKRNIPVRGIICGATGFGSANPTTEYSQKLQHNPPKNCEFRGYLSGKDLAALFRQADILCCPSVWDDPFPLVNLEAMASRLPVVSTPSGGIPEALEFGGGIIVPKNDPLALANALMTLVTDPTIRHQMADAAYSAYKKHFTWGIVYKNYRATLASL